MCGIVGYAGSPPLDAETLQAMSGQLTHRGPDDAGVWCSSDRAVGLSHRRLAIIDLSAAGRQPMTDGSGRLHIAFNGEIYNYLELRADLEKAGHRFRTATDTEVILESYNRWGEEFLHHIVGQFAIALYDEGTRRLWLARDRAGEKPLFVWEANGRVVFASELKAILALPDAPRRIDRGALEHYLAWGYVPRELCILAGLRKLAAGSVMSIDVDTGTTRTRRYWDLPSYRSGGRRAGELVEELEPLLQNAVRRQLVADVPVGVLLSGGVDSSLITAMASRVSSRPVMTFTVGFPGRGAYDESAYARLVASHFGTRHTELPAPEVDVDILPVLARQYDEPIADSSMIPTYLVSRLIRQHATVALGGDGGDELFGGYPTYVWAMRMQAVHRLVPRVLRPSALRLVRRLPLTFRGRNYLLGVGDQGFHGLSRLNTYFNDEWRARLLAFHGPPVSAPEDFRAALAYGAETTLQAAQRIDFRSYLPDDILVKVDRASMLSSLEVRAPFLDPSLTEFAFGRVPDSLKVNARGDKKILLRRLASRLLPKELDLARKQGFSIPLSEWIQGTWGDVMREALSSDELFDRGEIAALFAAQKQTGVHAHRIFALAVFELWRRHYGMTI